MTIATKLIRLALAFSLIGVNYTAKAQVAESRTIYVGLGLSAGIPSVDGYDYVLGADLRVQRDIARNVAGILSVGYTEFQQSNENGIADYGFIPLKLGAKVFPMQRLYLSGEIGVAIQQHKASDSQFLWAPGLGYNFDNGIDLGLRYEETGIKGLSRGQVAFRIAYNFNLSELMQRF